MAGSLNISDELLRQIEARARVHGSTVDAQAAALLTQALADEAREAEMLAEIRKERDEMASRGVALTDEILQQAKGAGRA